MPAAASPSCIRARYSSRFCDVIAESTASIGPAASRSRTTSGPKSARCSGQNSHTVAASSGVNGSAMPSLAGHCMSTSTIRAPASRSASIPRLADAVMSGAVCSKK